MLEFPVMITTPFFLASLFLLLDITMYTSVSNRSRDTISRVRLSGMVTAAISTVLDMALPSPLLLVFDAPPLLTVGEGLTFVVDTGLSVKSIHVRGLHTKVIYITLCIDSATNSLHSYYKWHRTMNIVRMKVVCCCAFEVKRATTSMSK